MASPVVVHCSAGVGRTGVVILVAVMKASLERNQVCIRIRISLCFDAVGWVAGRASGL